LLLRIALDRSAVDQRFVAFEVPEGVLAPVEGFVDGGQVVVGVGEGVVEREDLLVGCGGFREALLVLERDAPILS